MLVERDVEQDPGAIARREHLFLDERPHGGGVHRFVQQVGTRERPLHRHHERTQDGSEGPPSQRDQRDGPGRVQPSEAPALVELDDHEGRSDRQQRDGGCPPPGRNFVFVALWDDVGNDLPGRARLRLRYGGRNLLPIEIMDQAFHGKVKVQGYKWVGRRYGTI